MAVSRAKRKPLSKKQRFEILKRDQFTCGYCGGHPPGVLLHVDHIVPVVEGGTNDPENLVTSCEACNLGKGARSLKAMPSSMSERAASIAEAEAQLAGYNEIMRARYQRLHQETWQVAEILWPGSSKTGAESADLNSIRRFVERLGVCEVEHLARLAVGHIPNNSRRAWQYFCGCCWVSIRGESR